MIFTCTCRPMYMGRCDVKSRDRYLYYYLICALHTLNILLLLYCVVGNLNLASTKFDNYPSDNIITVPYCPKNKPPPLFDPQVLVQVFLPRL